MLKQKQFAFGNLVGAIYDFSEANDVLPMHTHDDTTAHITIVSKGSFKAHGIGWEKTLVSGNVVDFPAYQSHEFIALEPGSRLVNIVKS